MRNAIRLYSGLILASFVLTHLLNHSLGLISLEAMDRGRMILNAPWSNIVGGPLLLAAFVVHILNALYAIYRRTSLRMSNWEATQLSMGLAIPILLGPHLAGTFVGQFLAGHKPTYEWVVTYYWVVAPAEGGMQAAGLIAAWIHGSVGIHYWLRMKAGYARYAPLLLALAVAIPVAALSGFIAAGIGAQRLADADPQFVHQAYAAMGLTGGNGTLVGKLTSYSIWTALAVIAVPFALRSIRSVLTRVRQGPVLTLPDGRRLNVQKGATVLETLRASGIQHASVCGGRGRCTTCRVRILQGGDALAEPGGIEARALARIEAPPELRLACQIRPTASLSVVPLLPPRATADQGRQPGGLEGLERQITIVFIDLRGSTKLGETKLPYDVLFILNQFFAEMTKALHATRGHYSQFTGDGLMAIYGLKSAKPEDGARDALAGAAAMLSRIEALNASLESELPFPLQIGIGINDGEAIVGAMGPPSAQTLTAIGDSVNSAARLESLCKEHGKPLVIAKTTADLAGISLPEENLHAIELRGRSGVTEYYALDEAPTP
ncbi:2Fe-2S iron-sulfur cluster binding domain-containing protein [Hwanghaeella grinnelliae]|uniref:2Fe-2S iron-sulfur cluster binding domain-containing protein n=1 Tax=Hwanghaeella grinnelliae TaxID=2500179 RepID=A0A437QV52_9PROT|nr:adenylate/guanylate cyclase domain-containing protein [Hwanghaeella grinnelliae]RVU38404.1 2Fe-2S iron-sulfur cluster binding domain-containing protein [Hwanghaeella grinnelliae]